MADMNVKNSPRGSVPGARPKVKIGKNTYKRLMGYLKEYKFRFSMVFLCIIVSALAGVAGSMFIRTLIDDYITPLIQTANPNFTGLIIAIVSMGGIYLVGMFASFFYNRVMVTIAQGTLNSVRKQMFARMQYLPIQYFDTHNYGDTMSHYTNDADTLRQMIAVSIPQIMSSLVTIVAVFFAMLFTSFYLTLLVLVSVGIMLYVTKVMGGKSSKYFVAQQKSIGSMNGYIEEMINGQKVIKVFCHEEKSKENFDSENEVVCENTTKANIIASIFMPVMGNLGNLQYVLIAIVGGLLAVNGIGGITLGIIAAFLQLSKSFTMPITQVAQQINAIVMALAGAGRIFTLMDETQEVDEGYVTLVNAKFDEDGQLIETEEKTNIWAWKHPHKDGTLTYKRVEGYVELDEVDFAYVEGKTVLHDVTLTAEAGKRIAFVGSTGAGKTTITNLLNRFYDIADGKIRYDGININKIKKDDLRRSLGIVLQETNLFTGTVKENIRYGNLSATDEEIVEAAKLANAHDFITRLPEGYDTLLTGDGGNLSQGQRQLLSIARAAVANAPVMILDEATSSIDTRTESLIQKGTDRLMKGRTVFVIAHRLSTIINSDMIVVLEYGRIIEKGTHDELIAQKGKYYQLYTGAFELS